MVVKLDKPELSRFLRDGEQRAFSVPITQRGEKSELVVLNFIMCLGFVAIPLPRRPILDTLGVGDCTARQDGTALASNGVAGFGGQLDQSRMFAVLKFGDVERRGTIWRIVAANSQRLRAAQKGIALGLTEAGLEGHK